MKYLSYWLVVLFGINLSAQTKKVADPAYFFDGKLVSQQTIAYIEPELIATVNVIKRDTVINNLRFEGQLFIQSKNPKQFDFITLEQIKNEYTKVKTKSVGYAINGEIIKDGIETLQLNRNYILEVITTNTTAFYNLSSGEIQSDIIHILGKTAKNIKDKKEQVLKNAPKKE
ncbi:hypothetical protein [Flavobacterium glaciei]|uniref:Uncharacterized protein n=1 Tax=Flavobacterium glaciei TaxID=386300 RepID=A0A562Q1H4_9FLAO|nr:hypothetical protein [Flavobacterium glaciei]RDI57678.1 hypothetical protein DFR66_102302 [Flavobacterium glaciei]TWI50522.1 hypothetical protein IQ02_00416 [Flavobacterium glaciei]